MGNHSFEKERKKEERNKERKNEKEEENKRIEEKRKTKEKKEENSLFLSSFHFFLFLVFNLILIILKSITFAF